MYVLITEKIEFVHISYNYYLLAGLSVYLSHINHLTTAAMYEK
jgi:hypothetical protein